MRGTWDDLNRRLTSSLIALDLDDSIVVGDRFPVRKGFFGGAKPIKGPRRFVQVTAGRDQLLGECVGSTSFGGVWEMSPETEATLLRQGWAKPWSPEYPTFQREGPLIGAPKMALACVRALELLGCEMESLDVELVREDPEA